MTSGLVKYPVSKMGWLFALVIVVCSVAPSLGAVGSVLRLGVALLSALALAHVKLGNHSRLPWLATVALILLTLSLTICTLGPAPFTYGVLRLANWVMFMPLLPLASARPDMRGVGAGLVIGGSIQLLGIWMQATGLMGGTWGGIYSGAAAIPQASWVTRYTGFATNPNDLGLFLALGVIALLAVVFANVPFSLKLSALVASCLFLGGVFLSGSRGGLVAVMLGAAVVLAGQRLRGLLLAVVAIGALTVTLPQAGSGVAAQVVGSLSNIVSGSDVSAQLRSDLWAAYMADFDFSALFFGRGFGGYADHLFGSQSGLDSSVDAARAATIDNSWLKLLLEAGIFGISAMGLLFVSAIRTALRQSRNRGVATAAAAMAVALLWRSLSVDMLDINPWNSLVFLVLGLCFSGHNAAAGVRPHPEGSTETEFAPNFLPQRRMTRRQTWPQ